MKHAVMTLVMLLLLTACGSGTAQPASSASTETPTTTASTTPQPTSQARPTQRATPHPAQPTTSAQVPTAAPLLSSISAVRMPKAWPLISPILTNPGLQEVGQSTEGKPFVQDIPFKIEGITLVAHIELSAETISDGDVTGILYSRTDRTQWVIPVVVAGLKQAAPKTFTIYTVAQDPKNVISRTGLPPGVDMTVLR